MSIHHGRIRAELRVVPFVVLAVLLFVAPGVGLAQGGDEAGAFNRAGSELRDDLDEAKKQLAELRDRIEEEQVPLTRELTKLENELIATRRELDELSRQLDTRTLDLSNFQNELKTMRDEKSYLSSLLGEYVRNFETRIHVTEAQRYRPVLEQAKQAPENANLTPSQVFAAQTELVTTSLDRLSELQGGVVFPGTAVGEDGVVRKVDFALLGPVAYFHSPATSQSGLAEERLGSLEPNMVLFDDPQLQPGVTSLVTQGEGTMAFDPTLGEAQKIEETQDTLWEHIQKGGPVMVPILAMFAAAILVSLIKWVQLMRVPTPSTGAINAILADLSKKDFAGAKAKISNLKGPSGEMLSAGISHIRETRELVEEVMFEKVLETRLRLSSYLPFVAIAAAAAPLMGLLGTVVGIINTFKLITVQGTGDPKALSSGISEALITTEFGLIVAIPSLLLHAYLSRKARNLVDGMEKTAVSFLNRVAISPEGEGGGVDEKKVAEAR